MRLILFYLKTMNSKTYQQTIKETSQKLNEYFSDFCQQYPQYAFLKADYIKKKVHLNGIQFQAGFISGPNSKWEQYFEIAIIIELVMIWAYKTKWILDRKQAVWENESALMETVLRHDLILACINDLFGQAIKKDLQHIDKIRSLVDELMGKLSFGFWLEREKLNVKFSALETVMADWEQVYVERNNSLNLIYDYTPLIGFALSSGNFDILENYLFEIPSMLRFSNASQMISDLGDFGQNVDKSSKSDEDVFSDLKNGVITFPIFKLIDEKLVQKALSNPKEIKNAAWQKKMQELLGEKEINKQAIQIAAQSFDAHKNFFETHLEKPNPMLMRVFGMLINNKYFDQKVVFQESPVLRSRVVLCDVTGKEKGTQDKLKAHKEGKLHKAFAIFIFNQKGEHLIQKGADEKYHSVGLWSNTCCGHAISGEKLIVTAERKLLEELGIETNLQKKFSFVCKFKADEELVENEHLAVLIGKYAAEVEIVPELAQSIKWIGTEQLLEDIIENPAQYSQGLKIILQRMGYSLKKKVIKNIKVELTE